MNWLVILFLMAHGGMHASYLTPKPDDPNYPFQLDNSWLLGELAKPVGAALIIITIASFVLAGLAMLGVPLLPGKILVIIGSLASIAILGLFWHPWLVLGIVIDLIFLYGIWQLNWDFSH